MEVKAYLFNKEGMDAEVEFDENVGKKIENNQLLWINVLERKKETLARAFSILEFTDAPLKDILGDFERPKLEKFEDFYRFFINSVNTNENGKIEKVPIDFIVSKNIIVSIFTKDVAYFSEFRNLESGETHIGELDTESFIASLLDMHLVNYFRAVEMIERKVDKLDNRILSRDLDDEEFLNEILQLRHIVSQLRRLILPQRDVFYALSRPDFLPRMESHSAQHFQMLNQHYENAVKGIESSRDTVLSLFDLYTTKSAHNMNSLMKRLTFTTLLVGGLGAIAGIFGMNFEVSYFHSAEKGFWLTIMAMGIFILIIGAIAKIKNWI